MMVSAACGAESDTAPNTNTSAPVPPPQRISTTGAVDDVITSTALEHVIGAVADQQVVARAADRVFDGYALGNRNVTGHACDIGKRPGCQVDLLVLAEAREVQGVIAAAVPHRENHLGTGRGGAVEITVCRGVETVNGILGTGLHIGAVKLLDGRNIIELRS